MILFVISSLYFFLLAIHVDRTNVYLSNISKEDTYREDSDSESLG